MKTIVIASHNPVKIQATRSGFERMFPGEEFVLQSVSVPSGVKAQPMNSSETLTGATNRAYNARLSVPQADFWVGIEGGVSLQGLEMAVFAWIVVCSVKLTGKSRTGTFYVPPEIARLVRQGKELGEADDIVFNLSNSKQQNGAIGLLSGDVIDRTQLYQHAMILALLPFKNPHLYPAT